MPRTTGRTTCELRLCVAPLAFEVAVEVAVADPVLSRRTVQTPAAREGAVVPAWPQPTQVCIVVIGRMGRYAP
ncbi:hypothetical protein XmelCFBP4644_05155 [Xanthomonas melonis]|uniref:Uncharacterized protein n=1 Tax=Xanthomonas melonis TaxID=56456 RepID=A0A2S7DJ52_9XANT|nr:hypothetical protein XmelCFBP4644_05155 [Xanthomonas melonis]